MTAKSIEIACPGCGKDTLLKREPQYDGFKKVGERLLCASCKHEFASEEEVPFKTRGKPSIFTDADRLKKVDIFKGDEKGKNCRHCKHYVVNPFVQRCGLNNRLVEATDLCERFEKKEEPPPETGKEAEEGNRG
jgi:DNA-directed RNA polymerase subunit RPC12/RpoP